LPPPVAVAADGRLPPSDRPVIGPLTLFHLSSSRPGHPAGPFSCRTWDTGPPERRLRAGRDPDDRPCRDVEATRCVSPVRPSPSPAGCQPPNLWGVRLRTTPDPGSDGPQPPERSLPAAGCGVGCAASWPRLFRQREPGSFGEDPRPVLRWGRESSPAAGPLACLHRKGWISSTEKLEVKTFQCLE
jgi:hypothetical protein